jgi:hypothetical protein
MLLSTALWFLGARSETHGAMDASPPVFGVYPTGGPVAGGTAVTIYGAEFSRIVTGVLTYTRCSWGDPREWQTAVFAAQQAEMNGWDDAEIDLPPRPPSYFTIPYERDTVQVASIPPEARAGLVLPDGLTQVDQLVCDSYPRDSGDVSLWFSLRFTEALDANASTPWIEPNLMDSGFTFMYYPPPENFTNEFVTGGPLQGGTDVVIEGGGFTKGYRNESDIDISSVIVLCRFVDADAAVRPADRRPRVCRPRRRRRRVDARRALRLPHGRLVLRRRPARRALLRRVGRP